MLGRKRQSGVRQAGQHEEYRAARVRAPELTGAVERAREEQQVYRAGREQVERRSLVRGLLVLALLVLVVSVARAGLGRVFVPGWWQGW